SRLVTTPNTCDSFKNDRSLSSASATRYCEFPSRAFDPSESTRPPTTTVGSSPPPASTAAIIEVVVVLPCIPATAMPYFSRINSASISARWMTGIFRARASTTSGLSLLTAELVTTTSLAAAFAAAWPSNTLAPSPTSRSVTALRRRSLPETAYPIVNRISAIPLIPIPPIPIKWIRCVGANKKCPEGAAGTNISFTLAAPHPQSTPKPLRMQPKQSTYPLTPKKRHLDRSEAQWKDPCISRRYCCHPLSTSRYRLRNLNRSIEFNVGRRIANHQLHRLRLDHKLRLLLIPVSKLLSIQRNLNRLRLIRLQRNPLEALQLLARPRNLRLQMLHIKLHNLIPRPRSSIGHIHGHSDMAIFRKTQSTRIQVREFKAGIAQTITKGIEGLG